jgi:secondary thiamine-phosphate synthase enzyme
MVKSKTVEIQTKGFCDIIDITSQVSDFVQKGKIKNGIAVVFVSGSTAGVTTVEHESGLIKDLQETFEKLVPSDKTYHHDAKWGDDNGFSHVRSSLLGTSLAVPVIDESLALGTWQQIVLIDFDNRSRSRKIVFQILGE